MGLVASIAMCHDLRLHDIYGQRRYDCHADAPTSTLTSMTEAGCLCARPHAAGISTAERTHAHGAERRVPHMTDL